MKKNRVVLLISAAFLALAVVPPAGAQDAAQQQAMEAYLKNMAVNENHELLKATYVGEWEAETTSWMAPGAEPAVSRNACRIEPILGGRFVYTRFQGTMMGQPFEGLQIVGYDNYLRKFVTFWIDSTSTSFFLLKGDYDPETKTFVDRGEWLDVATGGMTPVRMATTVQGPDKLTIAMYMGLPDGTEYKSMENVYTRKK